MSQWQSLKMSENKQRPPLIRRVRNRDAEMQQKSGNFIMTEESEIPHRW
jgi:hypothetical protein